MKNSRAQWFHILLFYLRQLLWVNLIFLALGTLWRLLFLFFYGNFDELLSLKTDLLQAFFLGARFDATILFYVNALPLLLVFLLSLFSGASFAEKPLDKIFRHFHRFLIPYYVVMLFTVTFISAVDLGFYGFYQDRINLLIFGFIEDDTWALVKTIWRNYPILWIFAGLTLVLSALIYGLRKYLPLPPQVRSKSTQRLSFPVFVLFWFALFFLNAVGARGTLALFPLSEMDTGISKSSFINHLCFNGPRAFARAFELKIKQRSSWDSNLRYYHYDDNPRRAFADYFAIPLEQVPPDPLDLLKQQLPQNPWAEKHRPHVVLLVMESFGGYWSRYHTGEFDLMGDFQRHLEEDTYLKNFLSGSAGTIGSLSSLMVGSPQRPIGEFLTESEYLQVPFRTSLAQNFKNSGYQSRLVYGGNPGWRELNKFALVQGFDLIEGESEISASLGGLAERHDWGVYDKDVFDFVFKTLEESSTPQLILTMTTTNHPPYQLPKSYTLPDLKIPEELSRRLLVSSDLALKRFHTYRYSMDQVAHFLDRVKHSPLKDRIIVAITGDHTFWLVNFSESQLLDKGSVPFYLYAPQAVAQKLPPDRFGSHMDIPATLYSLALSNTEVYSLGQNLFAPTQDFALNADKLIIDHQGGVLTGPTAADNHYFTWSSPYHELVPGPEDSTQNDLAVKYKSLMGVLDYYFMSEKNQNSRH